MSTSSPDTAAETPRREEEWDSSWSSLERHMVQLYTAGPLRTIHQFWQRCYFEDLWKTMGPAAAAGSYLELGAGRGTTSMYLASRGCDVTMLDLSVAGFRVAEANFRREGLPAPKLVQADARDTRLAAESYDCVFHIGLLEHFEAPHPLLVEAVRLLRPGGLQFAVIMPERSTHIRFLTLGLLRPWALGRELMPEIVRRRMRTRIRPVACRMPMLRTGYTRADYLAMLEGLPVEDVGCVPYNPYHPVYKSDACEAAITIPLYRLHRSLKKLFGKEPLFRTAAGLASCDLLTFRKRP
jgi:2-polyprenyl-3-methyl-5-hydroxy-6-metoxy-1,4-benzoquinol methylase